MFADDGSPVAIAEPGRAVEVIGWRELPAAGDRVLSVASEVSVLYVLCNVRVMLGLGVLCVLCNVRVMCVVCLM